MDDLEEEDSAVREPPSSDSDAGEVDGRQELSDPLACSTPTRGDLVHDEPDVTPVRGRPAAAIGRFTLGGRRAQVRRIRYSSLSGQSGA